MINAQTKIISIKNFIVELEVTADYKPKINEVLTLKRNPDVLFWVYKSLPNTRFICICLTDFDGLALTDELLPTGQSLAMPVHESSFGKVLNIFGTDLKLNQKNSQLTTAELFGTTATYQDTVTLKDITYTGIKAIDFFTPIIRGGKAGIFGGAGVGKTVLLSEILHNSTQVGLQDTVSIFSGIGERSREAHELIQELEQKDVLKHVALILGTMAENPAIRYLSAYAAVALCQYAQNTLKKNVLFFIDNAFRFAQAGNELSTLLNEVPSEGGYQPNLFTQIAQLHERLSSNSNGFTTTIEAVYVPADDLLDDAVQTVIKYLDTSIVLSRDIYAQGIYPAIDLLASSSSGLSTDFISDQHFEYAIRCQALLKEVEALDRIVSLVGISELSPEDRLKYARAKKIRNYMTQHFYSVEDQRGIKGDFIPIDVVINDVGDILAGRLDDLTDDKFLFVSRMSS